MCVINKSLGKLICRIIVICRYAGIRIATFRMMLSFDTLCVCTNNVISLTNDDNLSKVINNSDSSYQIGNRSASQFQHFCEMDKNY